MSASGCSELFPGCFYCPIQNTIHSQIKSIFDLITTHCSTKGKNNILFYHRFLSVFYPMGSLVTSLVSSFDCLSDRRRHTLPEIHLFIERKSDRVCCRSVGASSEQWFGFISVLHNSYLKIILVFTNLGQTWQINQFIAIL